MNKILITSTVLVILAGAWMFLKSANNTNLSLETNTSNSISKSVSDSVQFEDRVVSDSTKEAVSSDRYLDFSQRSYVENTDKKRVLYFYANWCPTCQPVDRELKTTKRIPEDVVVFKIHYNDNDTTSEHETLAKKYAITYQHTFVIVDSQGNEIAKWNGGGLDDILNRI